jgi:hypothetical protein
LSDSLPGDGLMPEMEAIKIAQRHDRAAQGIGHDFTGVDARDGHIRKTVALSRQREALAKSRRALLRRKPPFDGRSRFATAAQGYGLVGWSL